ncbi:MAG TPA: phage tail terminator-like protein [Candidatus Obscuribacterales bacterium]
MSIYDDIRGAFEKRLSETSNLPTQIAWENVTFRPSTNTAYMQPRMIFTSRRPAVRFSDPQNRYLGVFQVLIYVPENAGPSAADDYADTLISAFDATTDISFTNASAETIIVSVDYAERENGIAIPNWYYVPVNIGWYIYSQ